MQRLCGQSITQSIEQQTLGLLNRLIQNIDTLHYNVYDNMYADTDTENEAAAKLRKEIEETLQVIPIDETAIREKIAALAAERYAQIDDCAYETERIRRAIQNGADAEELLKTAVQSITVHNGDVRVHLKI